MTKRDGSLHLDGSTSPFMHILLNRRSVRKYESKPAEPKQIQYIEKCVVTFCQRMHFTAARIVVVGHGEGFEEVVRGATRGLLGKINPWLSFTKASHMILCGAVYPDDNDRKAIEGAVAEASMAMQVAVLAATEVGLGTCWMAGIAHERIESAFSMPDGAALVAISTLGTAPSRLRMSWDALAYHMVSKRRKPLDELWMKERWRQG